MKQKHKIKNSASARDEANTPWYHSNSLFNKNSLIYIRNFSAKIPNVVPITQDRRNSLIAKALGC